VNKEVTEAKRRRLNKLRKTKLEYIRVKGAKTLEVKVKPGYSVS